LEVNLFEKKRLVDIFFERPRKIYGKREAPPKQLTLFDYLDRHIYEQREKRANFTS